MSIKKQFLKNKPVCKVTFSLTKEEASAAERVQLLGDFNNWNVEEAIDLKKFKNGSYKATLDLETEKEYQFKYLFDETKWENDPSADSYADNGISAEGNFVVAI
jgi:1,4-alpha-glucan branching enzyme